MNIIERYVKEVGKHLPGKNRLDIEAELLSTLEDMLEDRKSSGTATPPEEMMEELLQEFGPPRKVAETYQTHPYLIGPGMFSMYIYVLKIVLAAVILGLTVSTIIGIVTADTALLGTLNLLQEFGSRILGGMFAAFSYVTIIFAILERFLPDGEVEDLEAWTPKELNQAPDTDKISIVGHIFSIVIILAGLILLNFAPETIGMATDLRGEWTKIASLSEEFFSLLPWINFVGLLTVALNIVLLRQRAWQPLTRWVFIGVQIFNIAIAMALLRMPKLLDLHNTTVLPEAASKAFSTVISLAIPMILIIVIIGSSVEIVKTVWKLLRKNGRAYVIRNEAS